MPERRIVLRFLTVVIGLCDLSFGTILLRSDRWISRIHENDEIPYAVQLGYVWLLIVSAFAGIACAILLRKKGIFSAGYFQVQASGIGFIVLGGGQGSSSAFLLSLFMFLGCTGVAPLLSRSNPTNDNSAPNSDTSRP